MTKKNLGHWEPSDSLSLLKNVELSEGSCLTDRGGFLMGSLAENLEEKSLGCLMKKILGIGALRKFSLDFNVNELKEVLGYSEGS